MSPIRMAITAAIVGLTAQQAQAQTIRFFSNYGCMGSSFSYSGPRYVAANCKANGNFCSGKNDVAKSIRIEKPAELEVEIKLFDSPAASRDDDWASVVMLPGRGEAVNVCIPSFDRDWNRYGYSVRYHKKNGLAGKVSYIVVTYPNWPLAR